MGITVGDFDNDGRPDPYVANMYSKAGERNVANPRTEPTTDASTPRSGLRDRQRVLPQPGRRDLPPPGPHDRCLGVGWAYGPTYVDPNNDGLIDLYAPVGFQSITPRALPTDDAASGWLP
ncbi:MAG: hypothetical protein CM1200mP2_21290 [Planctomycetaceae bacterium]|nr:MAG: hypothetical protein CM1200mP2_21290 [Planctomycetaceae bacterium]